MTAITFLFVLLLIIVALGFALKLSLKVCAALRLNYLANCRRFNFDKTAFLNATFHP